MIPEEYREEWLSKGLNYTLNAIVCMDERTYKKANEYRTRIERGELDFENNASTVWTPPQDTKSQGDAPYDWNNEELGKTIAIETFKAEADRPVTLYNAHSGNAIKALRLGIFAPLGLGYDMYQDYGQYSGIDLGKVTLVNGGAFVFSAIADGILIGSTGLTIGATIPVNIVIATGANTIKRNWAQTDEDKEMETP